MHTDTALPSGITVIERGWLSANNILLVGEKTAIVDSGYATHAPQTIALIEAALNGRPLDLLLNTHLHSDHCGGNAALQARYPEVQTWVPPGHAALVQDWDPVGLSYTPTGQQCPRFKLNEVLQPDTDVQLGALTWQIHAAPGHDPHSVVLFQPDHRILISADALWERGFGVVFPELDGEQAFAEVGATLDLIERLAPHTIIPGHGSVFTDVGTSLAYARHRLHGFIHDPKKHVIHAGKVLLKFKLLELQRVPLVQLLEWACQTTMMTSMHRNYFSALTLHDWIKQLADSLVAVGAAALEDGNIVNT